MIVLVTGTDTGVGKTVATAALAAAYAGRGRSVAALKIAQTGVDPDQPGDMAEVSRMAGVATRELVRLPAPLAPETAARLAGASLPTRAACCDAVRGLAAEHDVVLVEGAGGVLVRLGEGCGLLEVAADLGTLARFVVVARAGLGTLNHSGLTVEAIRRAGQRTAGLLVGSWPADPGPAERENLRDLPAYTGVPVLGRLPEGAGGLPPEAFRQQAPRWLTELP